MKLIDPKKFREGLEEAKRRSEQIDEEVEAAVAFFWIKICDATATELFLVGLCASWVAFWILFAIVRLIAWIL